METKLRYFTIFAPIKDFTGRVGAVAFADGQARVSFDDIRDEHGRMVADEHQVSVGRSAVMFAKRRKGYRVVETDAAGISLTELAEQAAAEKEAKAAARQAAADKKAAEEAAKQVAAGGAK